MGDILFIAHRIPFPPNRGDKIRSWNVLKHLGTLSRVHLACFADDAADAAHLADLRAAMGGSLGEAHVEVRRKSKFQAAAEALRDGKPISLTAFDSPNLRRFVGRMLENGGIDTIYTFSGQMAQFVPTGARQRRVMDLVDVDSAKFGAYGGKGPMRWITAARPHVSQISSARPRRAQTLFCWSARMKPTCSVRGPARPTSTPSPTASI
jgi:hypothetical protein